ncbi:YrhB domain-containing protein [Mycolicibacterium mucogenicum]|uniref:YrhB domain-containing protein n=1 Tax=Mycolicibacterium mucogenicum TaxID=56689 RepID=UPI00226A7D58|nr:YrhB domain-containing protein [Mycolicibacterium mucogenicum]MCX8562580.1 YrhB domain-containing protein [Mycolicibacterium mucogenicum]
MAELGIDAARAKAIVEAILAENSANGGVPCVLVGEPTDYEFWWVQGYQSRAFIEDGDENAILAGNGPIVVPKDGSAPFQLSSALPAAVQMERIRAARPDAGA